MNVFLTVNFSFGSACMLWCVPRCKAQTFVANAAVVVSSFTVFLEVVRHVGGSKKLATNFAGDFVLMACKVWPKAIPCSKRRTTNLKYGIRHVNVLLTCFHWKWIFRSKVLPGTCGVSLLYEPVWYVHSGDQVWKGNNTTEINFFCVIVDRSILSIMSSTNIFFFPPYMY